MGPRPSARELAEVWKPGVPLGQNAEYVKLSRDLSRQMEAALVRRFSHGPSAATEPMAPTATRPQHNLTTRRRGRPGGKSAGRMGTGIFRCSSCNQV